jgi:hypothetical protein
LKIMKIYLLTIGWALVIVLAAASDSAKLFAANQAEPGKSRAPAMDYSMLIERLRAGGAKVEPAGKVDQSFFSVAGRVVKVHGEDVQVFQYPNAGAVESEAARVSQDGRSVGTTKPHWIGPPHFYQQGRLLVLYVGDEDKVIKALVAALGRQFAGQ